jgi:hypothetical protein
VERQGRLNAQQLKDLSDELAALIRQQSDARLLEVYIRMTKERLTPSSSEHNASPRFTFFLAITTPTDNKRASVHAASS